MPKDNQTKIAKRDQLVNRKNKNKNDKATQKKQNINSDDDNGDENNTSDSDNDNENMNVQELRKYVHKIFPSKYGKNRITDYEKLKQLERKIAQKKIITNKNKNQRCVNKVISSKSNNIKKNNKYEDEHEDEDEDEEYEDEDEEYEDEDDEDDEEYVNEDDEDEEEYVNEDEDEDEEDEDDEDEDEDDDDGDNKKIISTRNTRSKTNDPNKVNIIFTIGSAKDDKYESEEYSEYETEDNSQNETEDEDEPVSSSSSDEDISAKRKITNKKGKEPKNISKKCEELENINKKCEEGDEVFTQLKEMLEKNPNNKSIKQCLEVYKETSKKEKAKKAKQEKKQKNKNLRIFKKIIKDKNTTNDYSFYEKLEINNQTQIIKELREINKITRIEKPYRITLLESNIPVQFKAVAMKKINSLRYMEPGSGEFYKIKNWVDTFMRIPFGKVEELPINLNDGVEKCHDFMENALNTLNSAVYGLNDAKMQIMQMLGQLLTNPNAIGTAIAIHGPPGTGKTSLVKEGISKILNRPFAFIALGGATDSSFLEGHGYTYEGSTWGKIVQILIDSKCMNPVIYFDELDKISDTPKGEEIAGILTHLTDTSQNSQFHDKYFAEINFDLSKCLFIFSYNDETKVNPILRDRMYRIKTKGYLSKEKTVISNNYLLPKIREQVKFEETDIIIPPNTISYIIDNHCNKEDGVRNLKRCMEIIYTKLNLYRLMKPGTNIFEQDMSLDVKFPFTVTTQIVDKLIKREDDSLATWKSLYL